VNPFTESHNTDPDSLVSNADRDGYLFVRNLLNVDAILSLRRDIATILQDVGWLKPESDPSEAITSRAPAIAGTPEFTPIYDTIQKLESFHTLAHDSKLLDVLTALLGPDRLLQPSNIARVIFPNGEEHTTPPHQDYIHIQGTPDVWTAWIPLGDCPVELGGLSVLSGSHKGGILPVTRSLGAGGLCSDVADTDGEWVSSPFVCGDVLFFHSHTVHQGRPNLTADRLRLSVDYRYQRSTDPIMDKVLGPHQGRLSWDQVYSGWNSDRYQYYWEGLDLTPVSKTPWPVRGED